MLAYLDFRAWSVFSYSSSSVYSLGKITIFHRFFWLVASSRGLSPFPREWTSFRVSSFRKWAVNCGDHWQVTTTFHFESFSTSHLGERHYVTFRITKTDSLFTELCIYLFSFSFFMRIAKTIFTLKMVVYFNEAVTYPSAHMSNPSATSLSNRNGWWRKSAALWERKMKTGKNIPNGCRKVGTEAARKLALEARMKIL